MAHPRYPRIFTPIELGPVEIPNRFYSSPHAVPMNIAGKPTDDFVHYNAARAAGGCGLVNLSMSALARARVFQPSAHPTEHVPAFRALADGVHAAGGKIFGEPWYFWGSAGQWQQLSPPAPALGPSVGQYNHYDRGAASREMNKVEIAGIIDTFTASTANLREAGFDGVMLHAAHGALLEQFLSPYFNRRTDEYGGSLENRMRFLFEALEASRGAAQGRMAVGIRFNCNELLQGGYDGKDAYEMLKRLSASGLLDYVDLDIAVEPAQYYLGMPPVFVEPQVYRPYVEAVRAAAGKVPVMSVLGRITSIADAEAALEAGVCDMVGAARALIAEPNLVRNAYEGREDRSRTCIACNWCLSAIYDNAISCTINPSSYRERFWGPDSFTPAPKPSKVVVVGSGPAGMEAARTARLRGHDVILYEARDHLGGAFALWATLPGREFYAKAIEWWDRELRLAGVDIRLGTEATAAAILADRPDAVIVATGARYSVEGHSAFRDQPIPGHDRPFVYRPEAILLGEASPAGRVVVIDGDGLHTGVGVAELLAARGCEVEFLSPSFSPVSARLYGNHDIRFIVKRLHAAGVKRTQTSYAKEIGNRSVLAFDVYSEEERLIEDVDAVVLTTGRISVNALEKQLDGKVAQLFTVGDALASRMWATASFEGHKFARLIGEPGAPTAVSEVYFGDDDPTWLSLPADMPRPAPATA